MEQFSAAQVKVAPTVARPVAVPAAARAPQTANANLSKKPQQAAYAAVTTQQALSADERKQHTAERIQGLVNAPWQGMMVLLIPGWLARQAGKVKILNKIGLPKLGAHLSALGDAIVHAPQQVQIGQIWKMPSKMMEMMASRYRLNGMGKMAERFDGWAAKADGAVGKANRRTFGGWTEKASTKMDVALEGKTGGWLGRRLEGFAHRRAQKNMQFAMGEEAFTALKTGLEKHDIAFTPLKTFAEADIGAMNAAQRAAHFDGLAGKAEALLRSDANYGLRDAAKNLRDAAAKTADAARAAAAHHEALGGGLSKLSKNFMRSMGRTSVMGTLMGVGALAATAAAYYSTRHANKQSTGFFESMSADIGASTNDNNGYLKEVSKALGREKMGRRGVAVLRAGSEAVMAATMTNNNGMMLGALGMSAMAVPMLGDSLVPGNPVLNAYANLKQAENTNTPIPPADKAQLVRQLVGGSPVILPHGGYYNRMTIPVAQKIVADGLNLHETMQLVSNDAALTAYAAQVKAQMEAKAAATPKPANDHAHDHTNGHAENMQNMADDHEQAVRAHEEVPCKNPAHALVAHAHDVPRLQVHANDARHEGMLQEQQLAAGQSA